MEGIVLLSPTLDQKLSQKCDLKYKPYVTERKDLIRDIKGRTFQISKWGSIVFIN